MGLLDDIWSALNGQNPPQMGSAGWGQVPQQPQQQAPSWATDLVNNIVRNMGYGAAGNAISNLPLGPKLGAPTTAPAAAATTPDATKAALGLSSTGSGPSGEFTAERTAAGAGPPTAPTRRRTAAAADPSTAAATKTPPPDSATDLTRYMVNAPSTPDVLPTSVTGPAAPTPAGPGGWTPLDTGAGPVGGSMGMGGTGTMTPTDPPAAAAAPATAAAAGADATAAPSAHPYLQMLAKLGGGLEGALANPLVQAGLSGAFGYMAAPKHTSGWGRLGLGGEQAMQQLNYAEQQKNLLPLIHAETLGKLAEAQKTGVEAEYEPSKAASEVLKNITSADLDRMKSMGMQADPEMAATFESMSQRATDQGEKAMYHTLALTAARGGTDMGKLADAAIRGDTSYLRAFVEQQKGQMAGARQYVITNRQTGQTRVQSVPAGMNFQPPNDWTLATPAQLETAYGWKNMGLSGIMKQYPNGDAIRIAVPAGSLMSYLGGLAGPGSNLGAAVGGGGASIIENGQQRSASPDDVKKFMQAHGDQPPPAQGAPAAGTESASSGGAGSMAGYGLPG